jgi:hypothetical protein
MNCIGEAWTEEPIGNSVEEPSSTSIALLLPTQCNVKDLIRNVSFSWVGASERRDSYLWEAVPTVAQQTQMAAAEYWLLTKELDKQDPRPKSLASSKVGISPGVSNLGLGSCLSSSLVSSQYSAAAIWVCCGEEIGRGKRVSHKACKATREGSRVSCIPTCSLETSFLCKLLGLLQSGDQPWCL